MKQFYDKENYSWFDSKSKTWRYFIDKNKQQSDDNTEHIYNIYVDNKLVEDTIDSKLQKIISTILKKKSSSVFLTKKNLCFRKPQKRLYLSFIEEAILKILFMFVLPKKIKLIFLKFVEKNEHIKSYIFHNNDKSTCCSYLRLNT